MCWSGPLQMRSKSLQEFPSAVSSGVVQPTVAWTVHSIGIGPTVQQEFHHCNAVGSNRIAQGCDSLVVLRTSVDIFGHLWTGQTGSTGDLFARTEHNVAVFCEWEIHTRVSQVPALNTKAPTQRKNKNRTRIKKDASRIALPISSPLQFISWVHWRLRIKWFLFFQEGLDCSDVSAFGSLMQSHGRVFNLLQHGVELGRQTSGFTQLIVGCLSLTTWVFWPYATLAQQPPIFWLIFSINSSSW